MGETCNSQNNNSDQTTLFQLE